MTGWRIACGVLGLAGTAYGLLRLFALGLGNLWATTTWLAGGVLLHDGVLAPATIAAGLALASLWRRAVGAAVPAAVVVGAIVLGTTTVLAVPVLGRFGARPDNPTLLDRNYVLGWLLVATLTVAASGTAVVVATARGRRRGWRRGGPHGTGARGR
jgi:hypothetical protein